MLVRCVKCNDLLPEGSRWQTFVIILYPLTAWLFVESQKAVGANMDWRETS